MSSAVTRGDPRGAVGPVHLVDPSDALGEQIIVGSALSAGLCASEPRVERGAPDLDAVAEPLHLEGVLGLVP